VVAWRHHVACDSFSGVAAKCGGGNKENKRRRQAKQEMSAKTGSAALKTNDDSDVKNRLAAKAYKMRKASARRNEAAYLK